MTTLAPVTYLHDSVTWIDAARLDDLRAAAASSPTRRARYCLHGGDDEAVQEMVIALRRDSLVRPHRHVSRAESLCVLEGHAVLVVFNDEGDVTQRTRLGDDETTHMVRYRPGVWHTLIALTDVVIVHEVTQGPFDEQATEFAPWSPPESAALTEYLQSLVNPTQTDHD